MLETALVFLATLLVLLWWRSRPKDPPPSPGLALPVVGHLYLFRGNPIGQIHAWRERLGDIYTIQMGPLRSVIISGKDLISEALLKHHEKLMDRPQNVALGELFQHAGIIALSGGEWKEQRAFLQQNLRALGLGRNVMAERIGLEADYLLSAIEAAGGEPTDISNLVTVCVANVICGVTFGKRFDHEEKDILTFMGHLKSLVELLSSSAAVNYFGGLKYIPGDMFRLKELQATVEKMRAILRTWIDRDNRKVNVSDQAFEDLVQAFLTEIERKKLEGISATSLDERNLLSTAMSLFNAGTETTSNTLVFAVLYLVNHPDMQARLHREVKDVVGADRAPGIADRNKIKYLAAFIKETQRFSGVVPLGIDRVATADFHLGGYAVRQGDTVMINYDSMLRDATIWGDPENFRPDRFLDADGNVINRKELAPFGIGKRNCLGEGLASMELYLFISALVQKFEFRPEVKGQLPTMVPHLGFSRVFQPFKVRAILRGT